MFIFIRILTSKYSFINFCNTLIESIHRRNPMLDKRLNNFSKKIESIFFFDSIVSINFSSKKKLKSSELLENNSKLRYYFTDYRHKGNFIKTLSSFENRFGKLNENSFLYKLIRKLFHRNPLITLIEKIRVKKYIKLIKS